MLKNEEEFYAYPNGNKMGMCKSCYSDNQKKWRDENPGKRKAINKRHRDSHKEENRQYYHDNKERISSQKKEYYEANKGKWIKWGKLTREKNRDKLNERQRERRANDPKTKVDRYMEQSLRQAIKRKRPMNVYFALVGYSLKELQDHFEKTCSFEYNEYLKGNKFYQMDHIIPRNSYLYENKNDSECKKCWSYKNLRVTSREENASKGAKMDMNLVKKHGIENLLPEVA